MLKIERITLRSIYEIRSFGDCNAALVVDRWGLQSDPDPRARYGYVGTFVPAGIEFSLEIEGENFKLFRNGEIVAEGKIHETCEDYGLRGQEASGMLMVEEDDEPVRFNFIFYYQ